VKGKFSVIPNPACVGWLDRDLPGWSRKDLDASLKLVRELMAPDWDFHPEMITHTWVIDTKTGRPYAERTRGSWRTGAGQTAIAGPAGRVHELRLAILKNVALPARELRRPGGFGIRVLPELALGALNLDLRVSGWIPPRASSGRTRMPKPPGVVIPSQVRPTFLRIRKA